MYHALLLKSCTSFESQPSCINKEMSLCVAIFCAPTFVGHFLTDIRV